MEKRFRLEVSLLLLRLHQELDIEIVVIEERHRGLGYTLKGRFVPLASGPVLPFSAQTFQSKETPAQIAPAATWEPRTEEGWEPSGRKASWCPSPLGLPPLTHVFTVPKVRGGRGVGESLGEKVVLNLKLPATNEAGPLPSAFIASLLCKSFQLLTNFFSEVGLFVLLLH